MRSLFWRLLHRYGPEWAIHLLCSLCREEGICPKCIIDWEKLDAIEIEVTGPPGWGGWNTTTAGAQTTTWTYTATTGFLRSID